MISIAPGAAIATDPAIAPMDVVQGAAAAAPPAAPTLDTQITCALKAREILETANARGPRYQARGFGGVEKEILDLSVDSNYAQYTKLFVAALLGTNPNSYDFCKGLIRGLPSLQNSPYVIKALFLAARGVGKKSFDQLCDQHRLDWEPKAQQLVNFLELLPAGRLKTVRLATLNPTNPLDFAPFLRSFDRGLPKAIAQKREATDLARALELDPDVLRDRIMFNGLLVPEDQYNDPLNRFIAICRDARFLPPRTPTPITDPFFLTAAVQGNGLLLQHAASPLKNVLRIVEIATDQNGEALGDASPELLAYKKLVMRVVGHTGTTLRLVAGALKDDDEVILTAVRGHGEALADTTPNFFDSEVRVRRLFNSPGCGWRLVEYLPGASVLFADEGFKSSAMRYAPVAAARTVWRTPSHEGIR